MEELYDSFWEEQDFAEDPTLLNMILESNNTFEAVEDVPSDEVRIRALNFFTEFGGVLWEKLEVVNAQLATRVRSLLDQKGKGATAYARLFPVIYIVLKNIKQGKTETMRAVYYQLKEQHKDLFPNAAAVYSAIRDVAELLEAPRYSLGFTCASRGVIKGDLLVRNAAGEVIMDCRYSPQLIPGECKDIKDYHFASNAKVLLLSEKDTVQHRFSEDKVPWRAKTILVTAKGMPDMGTRAFLNALLRDLPHLCCVAVVDWNPCGVLIYTIYKLGGKYTPQYRIPQLHLLAACSDMLEGVPESAMQSLTARDKALINYLTTGPLAEEATSVAELHTMAADNHKCEVEDLYKRPGAMQGFTDEIVQKICDLAGITPAAAP